MSIVISAAVHKYDSFYIWQDKCRFVNGADSTGTVLQTWNLLTVPPSNFLQTLLRVIKKSN
jgi:hypothetical protein